MSNYFKRLRYKQLREKRAYREEVEALIPQLMSILQSHGYDPSTAGLSTYLHISTDEGPFSMGAVREEEGGGFSMGHKRRERHWKGRVPSVEEVVAELREWGFL